MHQEITVLADQYKDFGEELQKDLLNKINEKMSRVKSLPTAFTVHYEFTNGGYVNTDDIEDEDLTSFYKERDETIENTVKDIKNVMSKKGFSVKTSRRPGNQEIHFMVSRK